MRPSTRGAGEDGAPRQQHNHNPGELVRLARVSAGWRQGELGAKCGYSASQISRWETGRIPLRDVGVMRTLAGVLGLPPEAFGLTAADTTPNSPTSRAGTLMVGRTLTPVREEDDPVRRRAFLAAAGMASTSLAWSPGAQAAGIDPAALLESHLADVLLGTSTTTAEPATLAQLWEGFTAASADFAACRYVPLASRLSALIAAAEATIRQHNRPEVHHLAAKTYQIATKALIKLAPGASGLEWVSADRGMHAAEAAERPLALAESQRLVASVARRAGHYPRAQQLTLDAVGHLDLHTHHAPAEHLAMAGVLYCSTSYAAARAGDRARAAELLDAAQATAGRLDDTSNQQQALAANIVSHRVSAAYVLGDAGTALHHAHSLPIGAIPTVERRARLLVDTAMAYSQWSKPDLAYRTLLAAERCAPGEVRTRGAVRRLVGELLVSPRQAAMPGLRDLATRTHATT